MIILISGKQGSGKTTLASGLLEFAAKRGFVPYRLRFAEPLYKIHDAALPVLKEIGFVPPDCTKDGAFLQVIGTEYGRKHHGENIWTDIVRRRVSKTLEADPKAFITIEDARFENEFDGFPDAFRVRLEASEAARRERTHAWRDNTSHPSETGLDSFAGANLFDLYIDTGDDTAPIPAIVVAVFTAASDWYANPTRTVR
jgi:hypothetical protein